MYFTFSGGKPSDEHSAHNTQDYEQQLFYKIAHGTITDSDIDFILSHGDSGLKQALEKRHNELYNEKKYIDRLYGEGIFDGRDTEGNFYKDLTNQIDENTFIS